MARTAALLVPNTPEGKFYNALPDIPRRIADAVDSVIRKAAGNPVDLAGYPLFEGSKEGLQSLLIDAITAFSFDDIKQYGFQNTAKLIQNLPIFPSDEVGELVDFSEGKTPLEVAARRLPNGYFCFPAATSYALLGKIFKDGDTYKTLDQLGGKPKVFYDLYYGVCFSEEVAYWMTANPPVGLFGLDVITKLVGQISQVLDRGSTGGAWSYFGGAEMLRRIAQRWLDATGIGDLSLLRYEKRNVKYNNVAVQPIYDDRQDGDFYIRGPLVGWRHWIPVSNEFDAQSSHDLTQEEIKTVRSAGQNEYGTNLYLADITLTEEGVWNTATNKLVGFPIYLGGWGEGEGMTYANVYWNPGANNANFVTTGKATGLKAFLSSDLFKIVSIGLAIWGIGAALASISTTGIGIANVAQLTASVNNLPGVDLGIVGDVAAGISGGIKLAAGIPGAESMIDFDPGSFDLPEFDTGGFDIPAFDIPVIDPGLLEVDFTLADIGANVIDFDDSIFADFGLEATDLIPDDFGNIFTVTGDAVTLTPEAYVKSIYIDEGGNYRDYTNRVLLSQPEADAIFNESGADNDAVFAELANRAQGLAGNSFVAEAGPNGRPAGTPEPAAKGEVPWFQALSQEVMGWFKTVTSYSLAKEQLQKTGRYTPPYQTSPTGTAYSQLPGVPVRRADGTVVTNNGNGTQTIVYPNGQTQTVPVSVNPSGFQGSQLTPGSFGGQLIPGVTNSTLLIAGAGLIAVALLARRK